MNLRVGLRGLASALRPRHNQPSYYEDSSTDGEIDDDAPPLRRSPRSRHTKQRSRSTSPPSPQSHQRHAIANDADLHPDAPPKKKRRTVTPKSPKRVTTGKEVVVASQNDQVNTGKIPPWESLPYQILVDIFKFASYPFYDNFFRPNSSIHWLLDTATVCKFFCEPALAALYY